MRILSEPEIQQVRTFVIRAGTEPNVETFHDCERISPFLIAGNKAFVQRPSSISRIGEEEEGKIVRRSRSDCRSRDYSFPCAIRQTKLARIPDAEGEGSADN